jgi:hypothetical protein
MADRHLRMLLCRCMRLLSGLTRWLGHRAAGCWSGGAVGTGRGLDVLRVRSGCDVFSGARWAANVAVVVAIVRRLDGRELHLRGVVLGSWNGQLRRGLLLASWGGALVWKLSGCLALDWRTCRRRCSDACRLGSSRGGCRNLKVVIRWRIVTQGLGCGSAPWAACTSILKIGSYRGLLWHATEHCSSSTPCHRLLSRKRRPNCSPPHHCRVSGASEHLSRSACLLQQYPPSLHQWLGA